LIKLGTKKIKQRQNLNKKNLNILAYLTRMQELERKKTKQTQ
jgi:hypothetical protein